MLGCGGLRDFGRVGHRAPGVLRFQFSLSCGICICGVMFDWGGAGGLEGSDVRLAWVPGIGVECLGGRFFTFFAFFHLGLALFSAGGSL